jgi:isoleucyl-tRNA synthetase
LVLVDILAWTTTPWTLPSNTALTVGPKIDYVLKTFNQYTLASNVVLAKKLSWKQFSKGFATVKMQLISKILKKEIKDSVSGTEAKGRFSGNQVRTINAIGIAISKS